MHYAFPLGVFLVFLLIVLLLLVAENDFTVLHVDDDGAAGADVAAEDFLGQFVKEITFL